MVLNVSGVKDRREEIRGPLSLFAVIEGEMKVWTADRRVVLRPGQFFLTNPDRLYSLEIADRHTETLNVHFASGLFDGVAPGQELSDQQWLDDPEASPSAAEGLDERLQELTPELKQSLLALRYQPAQNQQKIFSSMTELLDSLIAVDRGWKSRQQLLQANQHTTSNTARELQKRMSLAEDQMRMTHSTLSLEELARTACMSKFHFLRSFKACYGMTPARFQGRLRLQAGLEALQQGKPIIEASELAGFSHLPSFYRAFEREFGCKPGSIAKG